MISKTVERLGFRTVRGSTSGGGSAALLGLIKKLTGGIDVAVTPDGPRGPRYHLQIGVIHLARISGCPIIPIAIGANRKTVLKSWDGFMIPHPFSKGCLIYGEPFRVSQGSDTEEKRQQLEKILTKISSTADSYYKGH